QLTPFPGTPLYHRLKNSHRLVRPQHWLDFAPFVMAHEPLNLSIAEAGEETRTAWMRSYSPQRNEEVLRSLAGRPLDVCISHLVARLFF
ncbi:hypothetical protein OFC04_26380, partial [Escherichia coli]|nr:hypothetical protein [Escherichia coli]